MAEINQNNGDMHDEAHVINDSVIATISLDRSSVEMSDPNKAAVIEFRDDDHVNDDVEGVDENASPVIGSPLNNTNENAPPMDGVSNEKVPDESANGGSSDENEFLFRLEFENDVIFDELATFISSRVRDALISLQKTVVVAVDKENHRVTFSKADDANIFMIDTLPTDKVNKTEVPSYKSITEALLKMNANKTETANELNDKPKGSGCWNCGGVHNMRDCKEPMNRDNIQRAKQLFQRTKTERYHLDADQKFAHFVPGTISGNLREALGLRKRELPLYIYKMRLYGYPPGWLEEAKVTRSGLTLFNTENSYVPDPRAEDGEVDKVTYDSKQFISYPGFNAAVPDGFIDDTTYYRVPPMQYQHSREGLMQGLEGNLAKSYKRKKLKLNPVSSSVQTPTNIEEDMDIDSESESVSPVPFPLPITEDNSNSIETAMQIPIGTQSPPAAVENVLENSTDASLATLTDLEEQKQKLLEALATANDNSNSNEASSVIATAEAKSTEDEDALDLTVANDNVECSQVDAPSTPQKSGRSREVVDGTPLLKACSPFASLPSGDKWSVGVSEVIDFENLPDATGTYKRLRGLISTVRTVVQQINDQNDAEDDEDDL